MKLDKLKAKLKRFNPRNLPNWVKPLIDGVLWVLALLLAFLLRFDGRLPLSSAGGMLVFGALLIGCKALGAQALGLHKQSWSRFAFRDLGPLLRHGVSIGLLGTFILLFVGPTLGVPRSIALLDALLSIGLMASVRALARYWHENWIEQEANLGKRKNILIIGAGEAGAMVAREMLRHPEMGLRPVGFLDDDQRKTGQRISTVPVLGTLDDLDKLLVKLPLDEVLIAIPSASGKVVRQVVDKITAHKSPVSYRIIPGVFEVLSGKVDIKRIRDVGIEDLLGREPIKLDTTSISSYLENKVVMVTGAGGSIGSEIVRQVCRYNPKELILFGHGENSIYQLERELDRDHPDITYRSVIGAIQNGVRLDYVFRRYKPQVIFHTAAHKHVPLMETNSEEAVFNNIIGSKNLVNLALKYGVSHFVNISTDKAVNPTSVMGASKRMVEFLVQDAAKRARPDQIFVSVRFGNVLGSRGSVIPVFKEQIKAGGPVTVTHPDMVRYFMTIPEAVQLVLQAAAQGENGNIYILDMGEPVRIVDLARDLIRLSGFEPDVDIKIEFTGMRPGEKLYEELMTPEERGSETPHEKIFVARVQPFDSVELEQTVHELQEAALRSDHVRIRRILEGFIEGCRFDYSRLPVEA